MKARFSAFWHCPAILGTDDALQRSCATQAEIDAFVGEVKGLVWDCENQTDRESELWGGHVQVMDRQTNQIRYVNLSPT